MTTRPPLDLRRTDSSGAVATVQQKVRPPSAYGAVRRSTYLTPHSAPNQDLLEEFEKYETKARAASRQRPRPAPRPRPDASSSSGGAPAGAGPAGAGGADADDRTAGGKLDEANETIEWLEVEIDELREKYQVKQRKLYETTRYARILEGQTDTLLRHNIDLEESLLDAYELIEALRRENEEQHAALGRAAAASSNGGVIEVGSGGADLSPNEDGHAEPKPRADRPQSRRCKRA